MSGQEDPPAAIADPVAAAPPATRWIGRHWRALALVALTLGALTSLAVLAYQLALARVPQHRATLEHFVQMQTGFEVRFATLEVGLGWHGPEARFTQMEMREPGQQAAVVRAPRLTVAFDTWRILRNGQVQAARLTLTDPEIDLAPLLASTARNPGAGGAPRVGVRLFGRLPNLRVDIEGGTLRLPPQAPEGLPHTMRISRAALHRGPETVSANAQVLLPPHLGRSLFLSLRMQGPLDVLEKTSGTLRLNGRSLAFSSWRDILTLRWVPAAGSGDVTASLDWQRGELEALEGEFAVQGVAWRAGEGQVSSRFPRLRAAVTARRRGDLVAWHITGLELDDGRTRASSRRLDLETRPDGEVTGQSAILPLGALLGLARSAGLTMPPELQALQMGGELSGLRFAWRPAARPGERLHAEAQLHGLGVAAVDETASLTGVDAEVRATDARLELHARAPEVRLRLPALFARVPEFFGLEGTLVWSREEAGWRLTSERLRLEHPAIAVSLHGQLARVGGDPPAFELRGTFERFDLAAWQQDFALAARWVTPAAVAVALQSGELESGEFVVLGHIAPDSLATNIADFAGRLVAYQVSVAGRQDWPEADGLRGELVWGGAHVRLELLGGRASGLDLEHATGLWETRSPRPRELALSLHGPIERARAWVDTQTALGMELQGLRALDLRGPARFELTLDRDRRRPEADGTWRVAAALEGGRLGLGATLPPVEHVSGTFVLAASRLESARLAGTWFDGPVMLHHPARRGRSASEDAVDYGLSADGRAGTSALLAALGLDAAAAGPRALPQTFDWTAELRHTPGTTRRPGSWGVDFRAAVGGAGVEDLPAVLAWANDARLPLAARLELPERGSGTLRLEAFGAARMRARLTRGHGGWEVERAALRFGEGTPTLPAEARVTISGEVDRLDPWATLVASRALGASGRKLLGGSVDVGVNSLMVGARELPATRLSGSFDATGLHVALAGHDLAGSIDWPWRGTESVRPARLRFARLSPPQTRSTAEAAVVLLTAVPTAEVAVDDLRWGTRQLGRLQLRTVTRDDSLELRGIRLASASFEARGDGVCRLAPRSCRGTVRLETLDLAPALRSLGFVPDLQAGRAEGELDLDWASAPGGGGWAGLSGRIRIRLENGTVESPPPDTAARPLPLFAAPAAILRASAPGVGFESLVGTFELGNYELRTRRLQVVLPGGELDITGRADLAARLYDQEAVLKADGGLPAALRRLREERSLSAVMSALRDFAGPRDRQRSFFTLRGSWDAPIVEARGELRR
ncbi:MAG: hypothetical protein IPI06_15075 [Gammaproteobacteria bacterium]|nr:hypothetical protein [Gammaproteobacteria bacterium]